MAAKTPKTYDEKMLRSVQRHSLTGIVALFVSLCAVAGYALVMDGRRADTIAQLSFALSEQRQQFESCTTGQPVVPASTCDEPVADEPSVIVKESEDSEKGLIGDATAVSKPVTVIGPTGPAGPSAYQIAIASGFVGSELSWLESLRGHQGFMGAPGLAGASAYQIARKRGFTGSEMQWTMSLRGSDGIDAEDGTDGPRGASAYEIAVGNGFRGSENEWLDSLRVQGPTGKTGPPGESIQGPPGVKGDIGDSGAPGKDATQEQANKAMEAYCSARADKCVGPAGKDGKDGKDGVSVPMTVDMQDLCPSGYWPDERKIDGINRYLCTAG